ncbi:hypothetical protein OF364_00345 [Mycoplasma enhydrae]|uniref:hypothetical protein n=1 Tax=Mycoplasma enhydrae TaxID=2499220 RepID=UPI0021E8DFD5|nr:hypothetical protein [Mycoplasma enhydrae]MCV3753268.1 hypothetical protein [Mycoplasma enhydrae]
MKTKKGIKKIAGLVAPLAILFSTPIIAISCVKTKKKRRIISNTKQEVVKGDVKYVAIGDDYAIGNNNSFNSETNNELKNNKIIGISYASYLANAISILNDEQTKLKSYENYGLQQSTSEDWLYLLSQKNKKSSFDSLIKFNKELSDKNQLRIKQLFGDTQNYDNKKLIKAIKESNLLTLSIGFNDVFKKNEILNLLFKQYKDENEFKQALNEFNKVSLVRIKKLEDNYFEIIKEIRKLNSKININLVGYIPPLLHFSLIRSQKDNTKMFYDITSKLNDTIKNVAKEAKINYYGIINENYIAQNSKDFSSDLLSVFPSNKAYKKLAQDIFIKMSISAPEYDKLFKTDKKEPKSEHSIAIDFKAKASDIKTEIIGFGGLNVETHKKEYPFEKEDENKELIESENNNSFSRKILLEFKSIFNVQKTSNPETIKKLIKDTIGFLGLSEQNSDDWLNTLLNLVVTNENKAVFIRLINQVLDSKHLNVVLKEANIEASELLTKKSYETIKIKEIREIFIKNLRNKQNSYNIAKDVFTKEFVSNEENKKFLKHNLPILANVVLSNNLAKSFLPESLANIWTKAKDDSDVLAHLNNLTNKVIEVGLEDIEKFFSHETIENFVAEIIDSTKKETMDFAQSLISWLSRNESDFNILLDNIMNNLKSHHQIEDAKLDDIRYFIKHLILNLKDFKYNTEIFNLIIQAISETKKFNKKLAIGNVLNEVVQKLIFDKIQLDEGNKIFFALISFKPNDASIDYGKYKKGFEYLGLKLIKIEELISIQNLNNILKPEYRDSILKLLDNISANKHNELNEEGKNYIKALGSLAIDTFSQDSSLVNQLLDNLGNYAVIHPLTNYLKNSGLEAKILALNPKFNNLEDYVKDTYKNIYKSINSPMVINQLKQLINDLVDNGNNYDKSSTFAFSVSALQRAKENGLLNIISTILNELENANKDSDAISNIINSYLVAFLDVQMTEEERNLVSSYVASLLKEIGDSKLYKNFEDYFISIMTKLDKNQVNDFEKLGNYLKTELSKFISLENNSQLIAHAIDLISLRNSSGDGFHKFIKIISLFSQKEKVMNFIIQKVEQAAKNSLGSIKNELLKLNENGNDFADATVNKIKNILLDKPEAKDIIKSLIESVSNLSKDELEEIKNVNDLLKKILNTNKNKLSTFIKENLNGILADEDYIKKLFSFTMGALGKKHKFDVVGNEVENISSFLWRALNSLEGNNQKIISNLVSQLFESVINVDLFDEKQELNIKKIASQLVETFSNFDFVQILDSSVFDKLSKDTFLKTLSKEQLTTELTSLINYLARNIPKIPKPEEDDSKPKVDLDKLFKNIEKVLANLLVGISGSIEAGSNNVREALIDSITNTIKDQINNINIESENQKLLTNEEVKNIANKLIEKQETKTLIKDFVEDFLVKNKLSSNKTFGETLNELLTQISINLKTNAKNLAKAIFKDDDIINLFVNKIVDILKLENVEQSDKTFLAQLIKNMAENLLQTEYFEKKLINRTINIITKSSLDFSLKEPTKWIIDAIDKIKSAFSFEDAKIVATLIGENKPIDGATLVKLVNLLFEKSNFEKSTLFNALRSLNMDPNHSKRSNMKTLNEFILPGGGDSKPPVTDPDNVTVDLDFLVLADTIFKILWQTYEKSSAYKNPIFKERAKTPEWKGVYRLYVALNYIIFEMFGRETEISKRERGNLINLYSGGRAILWELQEATNLSLIPGIGSKFGGLQRYFKKPVDLRQFTNYAIKRGFFTGTTYFNENNYGPESIMYILISSGYKESEKDRLKNFKFKITEDGEAGVISKKEYILLTLKEGGYGKFMSINDRTSASEWSELNKVKKGEFY